MTIFLHIGSHKTGTTSIQRYLSRHRDHLSSQGIWYPKDSDLLAEGRNSYNHLNIARSLDCTGRAKAYSHDQLRTMVAALVAGARNFQTTILSAEAFWRIGFGHRGPDGDDSILWRHKAENVAAIRGLFGDAADVVVVGVLRERSSYIQSSYSEFVLATLYRKKILAFLREYRHVPDYLRQLEAWERHFPVRALSYERLCRDQTLPRSFLTTLAGPISIEAEANERREHFNVGHPIACVLFKRYLNRVEGLPHEKRIALYDKGRRQFLKASRKGRLGSLAAINSWLSAKELRRLRRSYRDDDERVRGRFCPELVTAACTGAAMAAERPLVPLERHQALTALGWMLEKQRPERSWFPPSP